MFQLAKVIEQSRRRRMFQLAKVTETSASRFPINRITVWLERGNWTYDLESPVMNKDGGVGF